MDPNNRFGVLKALTKTSVVTAKVAEIGVCGLGDNGLGAAPKRLERLERTGLPLAVLIGQG